MNRSDLITAKQPGPRAGPGWVSWRLQSWIRVSKFTKKAPNVV